jgi:hypothetical protein
MAELSRRFGRAFRALDTELKAAAVGALLLALSTFGPFSFVEAAGLLIAAGVLALLFARGDGKRFQLPFADGTLIAGAGVWAGALIVARLFERPLGQNLLALACAAILFLAGARERAKHPPDESLVEERRPPPRRRRPPAARPAAAGPSAVEAETEPLPPPEFEPYRAETGEQLRLGPEDKRGPRPPAH